MHTVWISLGGTTYKGTMLLPSVIAVYSTRDQTLRKRHKGHKQKGYVELLSSVSTSVCPKYLPEVCYLYLTVPRSLFTQYFKLKLIM